MKPIIGITVESTFDPEDARTRGKIELNWNYFEMVSRAGGVPIVIPPTADVGVILSLIHGWLIPGGLDIDASRFGDRNHPSVTLQDPSRFEIEEALYESAPIDLPILGICYGCQFLNVIRGGTLNQHIPDDPQADVHTGGAMQTYRLEDDSRLGQIFGQREVLGKSYHHQSVDRVGQGLQVVSRHQDGTVEALESRERPWTFAVQWHPERTPNDEATRRLFADFIEAARKFARRKVE
jgi:putative glutamine amidotransferase